MLKNNWRCLFIYFLICNYSINAFSQNYSITVLHDSLNTSLRGLAVVNDSVIWVSGSNGYVGKSLNGGRSWDFQKIMPFDSAEFRDIEAFDENTAIVMSSVQPPCILKTMDGGKTWKEVYRDQRHAAFLDAIDFYNGIGSCIGDPVDGWFLVLTTPDSGNTWREISRVGKNDLLIKVAAFAASGSVIKQVDDHSICFATGGVEAFIFYSENNGSDWQMMPTDILHGSESSGIFSFDMDEKKHLIAAGGDYLNAGEIVNTMYYLKNFNKMGKPVINPVGYISCVKFWDEDKIIACGTNGIAITNWPENSSSLISNQSFNVAGISGSGKSVFFAGGNGRIAKLIIQEK